MAMFLVQDWQPSLPRSYHMSIFPWLSRVVDTTMQEGSAFLCLRRFCAERQWNMTLSWMLGVVGARTILEHEQYTWIAPLSAFYDVGRQTVDLLGWHDGFQPTQLVARRPAGAKARLRPDYVAVRENNGKAELAIVEAKGTGEDLMGKHDCPEPWRDQVANAELYFDGQSCGDVRRLVVATRYNPRAVRDESRQLVIRAWNRQTKTGNDIGFGVLLSVVTAALFGICSNLGLSATAEAVKEAHRARSRAKREVTNKLRECNQRADRELEQHLAEGVGAGGVGNIWAKRSVPYVLSEQMTLNVGLTAALLSLINSLRQLRDVDTIRHNLWQIEEDAQKKAFQALARSLGEPDVSRTGISVTVTRS